MRCRSARTEAQPEIPQTPALVPVPFTPYLSVLLRTHPYKSGHSRPAACIRASMYPPSVRGIAHSTPNVGFIHTRFVRAGCPRARRGRARSAFCRSKRRPSAPEHCGREFSGRRNSAVTAERRPLECKKNARQVYLCHRRRKRGSGESAWAFPRMARNASGFGAGRGKPRRKAPHQIAANDRLGFTLTRSTNRRRGNVRPVRTLLRTVGM